MQTETTELTHEQWRERGPWLVVLLLPLAALAFRRGWLLMLPLSVAMLTFSAPQPAMAFGWADLWQRQEQLAADALAAGDNARAAELARDPQRKGTAEYRNGNYEQALAAFVNGGSAHADYNRANALAKLGRFEEALDAYERALQQQPDMADATHNKKLIEDWLKQQQQQDQSQTKDPDKGRSQQQQDESQSQDPDQQQSQQQGQGQTQDPNQQQSQQQGQGETQDPNQQQSQQQQDQGQDVQQAEQRQDLDQSQNSQQDQDGQPAAEQSQQGQRQDHGKQQAPQDQGQDQEQRQAEEPGQTGQPQDQRLNTKTQSARSESAQADEAAAAQQQRDTSTVDASKSPAQDPLSDAVPPRAVATADGFSAEEQRAVEQWLRRIPDDPGGLLRRKFLHQYRQRGTAATPYDGKDW